MAVWPSDPTRYLPGDFWPEGRGIKIGSWERETMRLGLDLRGGARVVLEAQPPDDYEGDIDNALDGATDVIERRVNSLGVTEAEVRRASNNRIEVSVPGITLEEAQNLIGQTAQLEFRVLNEAGQLDPRDRHRRWTDVDHVGPVPQINTFPSTIGTTFAVNFETTSTGAKLMEQITSKALAYASVGDPRGQLLIYLDDDAHLQRDGPGHHLEPGPDHRPGSVHGRERPLQAAQQRCAARCHSRRSRSAK